MMLWNIGGATATLFAFCSTTLALRNQQNVLYSGNITTSSCEQACTVLAEILGEGQKLYYHTFNISQLNYFSARHHSMRPACLATPSTPQDVSVIMKVISQHTCPFAAKSGGHAMFPGSSSAPNGITIDLKALNTIEFADNDATLKVGTGNLWTDVFNVTDPKNLTVVGGRVGTVGVGGFLLGGGVSYASRKYGWGADNVRNFEVVLANGSIADVNYKTHPDLYWALRGGGAGFGIVTRFDLETHPLELVWGDLTASLVSDVRSRAMKLGSLRKSITLPSKLRSIAAPIIMKIGCLFGFCTDLETHLRHLWSTLEATRDDQGTQVYGYRSINSWGYTAGYHMTNFGGNPNVVAFQQMKEGRKLRSLPQVQPGIGYFSNELSEISESRGRRVAFSTLSFKNPDLALMLKLNELYIEVFEPLHSLDQRFWSYDDDILMSFPMMFISKDDMVHMAKNGGNPLGLKPEDGPLLIFCMTLYWPHEKHDEAFSTAEKEFINKSKAYAEETGQLHPFLYQNYAAEWQDVFEGYGEQNRAKLRNIQKKYDAEDVFQRLQSGYFKV